MRIASRGRTGRQTDRETNMTKLIVAFRNFTNAQKIILIRNYLFKNMDLISQSSAFEQIRMELLFHPDPAAAARQLSASLYDI
jgi:hypothetical protein